MHVCQGIALQASLRPHAPALEWADEIISHGEWWRSIRNAAAVLRAAGVTDGTTVAILVADPVDHLLAYLGATLAGALVVPLESSTVAAAVEPVLSALDCRLIVTETIETAGGRRWLAPDALRAEQPVATLPTLPNDVADRPVTVAFSSGTTGRSKAVVHTHRLYAVLRESSTAMLGMTPADRNFAVLSMGFNMGRLPAIRTLSAGGVLVIPRPMRSVELFVEQAREARITQLTATPTHVRDLLERTTDDAPWPIPTLRLLQVSTAILTAAERARVRRVLTPNLFVSYGTNEMTFVATATPADLDRHPDTVGRALSFARIEIVDDDGRVLPPGRIGHVRLRVEGMPTTYIADAEATDRSFRDGWFHPGDLGEMNEDGYLFLRGRSDDMINVGGVKVYPSEIEAVLTSHPAVAEAAVVAIRSRRQQQVPIAAVVVRAPVVEGELVHFCEARLGRYRTPRRVVVVPELPRNPAGKVVAEEVRVRIAALLASARDD